MYGDGQSEFIAPVCVCFASRLFTNGKNARQKFTMGNTRDSTISCEFTVRTKHQMGPPYVSFARHHGYSATRRDLSVVYLKRFVSRPTNFDSVSHFADYVYTTVVLSDSLTQMLVLLSLYVIFLIESSIVTAR